MVLTHCGIRKAGLSISAFCWVSYSLQCSPPCASCSHSLFPHRPLQDHAMMLFFPPLTAFIRTCSASSFSPDSAVRKKLFYIHLWGWCEGFCYCLSVGLGFGWNVIKRRIWRLGWLLLTAMELLSTGKLEKQQFLLGGTKVSFVKHTNPTAKMLPCDLCLYRSLPV